MSNQFVQIFKAATYSWAGLRVLAKTRAGRQEMIGGVIVTIVFLAIDATTAQHMIASALLALVLCAEALNTAIELIVDKLSPEVTDFARDAKDLGSAAVFCLLMVWLGYVVWVIFEMLI